MELLGCLLVIAVKNLVDLKSPKNCKVRFKLPQILASQESKHDVKHSQKPVIERKI